jgi:hypothetical protein
VVSLFCVNQGYDGGDFSANDVIHIEFPEEMEVIEEEFGCVLNDLDFGEKCEVLGNEILIKEIDNQTHDIWRRFG